jgi:hypothetical protein
MAIRAYCSYNWEVWWLLGPTTRIPEKCGGGDSGKEASKQYGLSVISFQLVLICRLRWPRVLKNELSCGSDWSTCGFRDTVGEYVCFLFCVYRKLICMAFSALVWAASWVFTVYLVCGWVSGDDRTSDITTHNIQGTQCIPKPRNPYRIASYIHTPIYLIITATLQDKKTHIFTYSITKSACWPVTATHQKERFRVLKNIKKTRKSTKDIYTEPLHFKHLKNYKKWNTFLSNFI